MCIAFVISSKFVIAVRLKDAGDGGGSGAAAEIGAYHVINHVLSQPVN